MRRLLPLLLLLVAGCGGSGSQPPKNPAALNVTGEVQSYVWGIDAAGSPLIAYTLPVGRSVQVVTAQGRFPVDLPPGSSLTAVAGDELFATGDARGAYVVNLRTKVARWVRGVPPLTQDNRLLFRDGSRVLLIQPGGTLTVQSLDTGETTPVAFRQEGLDRVLDFRNGRLLVLKSLDASGPVLRFEHRVVGLDGTLLTTLALPAGVYYPNPTALNANGEVAGTATRPGAIIAIDGNPYPVRWNAAGVPTFLRSDEPVRVFGLRDDGAVAVGPEYGEGPVRIIRDAGETQLGVRLEGREEARVEGGALFLYRYSPALLSAYALP